MNSHAVLHQRCIQVHGSPRIAIGRFGVVHDYLGTAENEPRTLVASGIGLRPFTATKVSINTFVQWIGLSSSG
jgi:hypothetical protein